MTLEARQAAAYMAMTGLCFCLPCILPLSNSPPLARVILRLRFYATRSPAKKPRMRRTHTRAEHMVRSSLQTPTGRTRLSHPSNPSTPSAIAQEVVALPVLPGATAAQTDCERSHPAAKRVWHPGTAARPYRCRPRLSRREQQRRPGCRGWRWARQGRAAAGGSGGGGLQSGEQQRETAAARAKRQQQHSGSAVYTAWAWAWSS